MNVIVNKYVYNSTINLFTLAIYRINYFSAKFRVSSTVSPHKIARTHRP